MIKTIWELIRNLINKPITVRFPKQQIEIPEGFRGEHKYELDKCISCGLCSRVCPNRAIEMVEAPQKHKEKYPKKYPRIDLGKCCFCGFCEDICPTDALKLTKNVYLSTFDIKNVIKEPFEDDVD
ncbi:MAG: NADH:ubiquinone oxidoreductase chain I-like protein [Candidatus Altiarchaeales archaeon ex4484_96]|nr:MAG: NADH:ubiquinone oxidoreductase chain I-like protein [Candidatus Altiarchaeales archaeon ex4484_96]